MKIFDSNIEELSNAVRYFTQLPEENKISITANLHPDIIIQYPQLNILLNAIANALGTHPPQSIAQALVELGMDETYALLLPSNMKKQVPIIESILSDIKNMPDEKFCSVFPLIIKEFLKINNEFLKINEDVPDKYDCTNVEYDSMRQLFSTLMNPLLRNQLTFKDIEKKFQGKIDKPKLDVLIEQLKNNHLLWFNALLFDNTQHIRIVEIPSIQNELLSIKQLLKYLIDRLQPSPNIGK